MSAIFSVYIFHYENDRMIQSISVARIININSTNKKLLHLIKGVNSRE